MNKDFRSDNTLGCSPEILEAVAKASSGSASAYGFDAITDRLRARVNELFETEVDIIPVTTGTGGNALAISSLTPSWGGVFCHSDAHVHREELGAAEFFSGGAKLIPVSGRDGKIHADELAAAIHDVAVGGRMAPPACLSLTQATEAGTVYTEGELRALCSIAQGRSMGVHVDGARFANAVASIGCSPADLSWRTGVDVLVFGATKNGAMAAELLVIFRRSLTEELQRRLHRSGHRWSKMRFLSAQLDAYFTDDLWLRNARRANDGAQRLAAGLRGIAGCEIIRPVDANVIFVRFSNDVATRLRARGFEFYEWQLFGDDAYRLVTGFTTTNEEVDAFIDAAKLSAS